MPITDLTGTTWLLKNQMQDLPTWIFNINFTSNGNNYARLFFDQVDDDSITFEDGTSGLYYTWVLAYMRADTYVYKFMYEGDNNEWHITTDNYKTISFTGGYDATNATLISWLQANATQIIPYQFSHKPKGSLVGSGSYRFRHYGEETPVLAAGLYNANDVLVYTWQQLIDNGYVTVSNNSISDTDRFYLYGKLVIDSTILGIGNSAFDSCSGLTAISIPNSVTDIGFRAFSFCSALTSITIPSGVTNIGTTAFSIGCSSLESITVEAGNTVYHSAGNCLIETSTGNLLAGCKNSVIPSDGSITKIYQQAFCKCTGLTSITIPNGVTTIGYYAFDDCTGLTSVTIANSVTTFNTSAFDRCSALTSITFNGTKAQWNAITKGQHWDDDTGNYTVHCTDGDIPKNYSISVTTSNVTASASNPTTIYYAGGTATLVFTADSGFALPDDVEVTGATGTWTKSTGELVLSNPTGNISVSVIGVSTQSSHTVTVTLYGREYEAPDDSQFDITSGDDVWSVTLPIAGSTGEIYTPDGQSINMGYDTGATFTIYDTTSIVIGSTSNADYSLNGGARTSLSSGATLNITQDSTLSIGYDYDT